MHRLDNQKLDLIIAQRFPDTELGTQLMIA
jgi:hypothetical protein